MKGKLSNWVLFPRQIAQGLMDGKLTLAEFTLLCALRGRSDPYGKLRTSYSDIKYDIYKGKKTENYTNKLMLALKKKQYLYFERHSGFRGSFDIEFGDLILPSKDIKSLGHFFSKGSDGLIINQNKSTAEEKSVNEGQRLDPSSQRSQEKIDEITQMLNGFPF